MRLQVKPVSGAWLPFVPPVAVTVWVARPEPVTLTLAAILVVVAALADRPRPLARSLSLAVLVGLTVLGFVRMEELRRMEASWSEELAVEEARIAEELRSSLAPILDRGPELVTTLAEVDPAGNGRALEEVDRLRSSGGFQAAALFDPEGRPVLWSGEHRGRVPLEAALGQDAFVYFDRPLAGYLYLTAPTPQGGTAVLASLLRSDFPPEVRWEKGDFSARFAAASGARIRIQPPDRIDPSVGEPVFDLTWEGATLFSVSLETPSLQERREEGFRSLQRLGMAGAVSAWFLAAVGSGGAGGLAAGVAGILMAVLLPTELLASGSAAADPAAFLLLGLPLIRWGVVVAACGLAVGLTRAGRGLSAPLAGLGLAILLPVMGTAWSGDVAADFISGADAAWTTWALLLCLAASTFAAAFLRGHPAESVSGRSPIRWTSGWILAFVLPLALARQAAFGPGFSALWMGLWAVPVWVWGPSGLHRLRRRATWVWLAAGLLGTGAVLPFLWGVRTEARLALAEMEVERLGVQEDPYLEILLERLALAADSLTEAGARPVEVLYGAWRASGMAEAAYPVWMTLWTEGGLPREDLKIGTVFGARPAVAAAAGISDPPGEVTVARVGAPDAHYLLRAPMADGHTLTGVVPPVREAVGERVLGPLFGSLEGRGTPPLTLIPLFPDEEAPDGEVSWTRVAAGWRGELGLRYPEGEYHAQYLVELSGPAVAFARATLLLAGVLGALGVLVGLGRTLSGVPRGAVEGVARSLGTFRARVTLALFAFFALSNLILGLLAYRALAGASARAAQVLAERVAAEAAGSYLDAQGSIDYLAQRVGSDLLEYRDGGLREGSPEALTELGLYEGWVPYPVYRDLTDRTSLTAAVPSRVGPWAYVTAYRRLPDGDILGAPIPLETGATAVRSREIVHLLASAVLVGLAFSLVLALLVGRALVRPIQTLRVASERVGSGNLGLRLPDDRTDEFGTVFQAFNRMVRRLRRARRNLVRTTRRTRTIVEDAATGVVALDPEGQVTLVNPRARTLLSMDLVEGEELPATTGPAGSMVEWIEAFLRDGLVEGGTELQLGDRRLQVRARRIRGDESGDSGVVVSLEDVTDELRAERILAWGEMARQVAHEVKNPLTPIKLNVQHLRRAWEDQRADFGDILTRNADAVLREIDRLAEIATGFSRFGAPAEGGGPLTPVDLDAVVEDVLTLYGSGQGAVSFDGDVASGLPPVQARAAEVKEVLVNLLENSRAAVSGAGRVRVVARSDGDEVVLTVEDDGVGIAEPDLARIFEPRFSTRSSGTGLGLAIVKRLVLSWGGEIAARSTVGEGTRMAIRIPVWQGPPGTGSPGGNDAPSTSEERSSPEL